MKILGQVRKGGWEVNMAHSFVFFASNTTSFVTKKNLDHEQPVVLKKQIVINLVFVLMVSRYVAHCYLWSRQGESARFNHCNSSSLPHYFTIFLFSKSQIVMNEPANKSHHIRRCPRTTPHSALVIRSRKGFKKIMSFFQLLLLCFFCAHGIGKTDEWVWICIEVKRISFDDSGCWKLWPTRNIRMDLEKFKVVPTDSK